MNYALLFKLLSFIAAIVAAAFGLCLGVSQIYSENPIEAGARTDWITSFVLALVVALIFYLPGRNARDRLFRKEAMCVVGLGWLLSSLLGAVPYVLILSSGFSDAFFESASGFTSTGASVYDNLSEMPHSILFWRSLTQWIGGLGVIVLFVAILSSLGAGAKVLYSRESSLNYSDLERGRLKSGIWRILRVYLVISALCAAAYYACGISLFDAVCHMFATVSTGGFSVRDSSIAEFSSRWVEWVGIVFMFIGGTSFILILKAVNGNFRSVRKNTEFKAYALIVALMSLVIFACIADFKDWTFRSLWGSFTDSLFQVVSLLTSTGFTSVDYQKWPPLTHVLIFMMFVTGACSGSTSGGLKIFRAVGVLKISLKDVEKSFRPNVVRPLRMNGRVISEDGARNMLSFVALYLIVAMIGILFLAAFERDMSFGGVMATVVSAVSNIGPGLNETGPTHTFSFMTDMSKLLLGFLMIMGRLEFYAILALFMPSLWKKFS